MKHKSHRKTVITAMICLTLLCILSLSVSAAEKGHGAARPAEYVLTETEDGISSAILVVSTALGVAAVTGCAVMFTGDVKKHSEQSAR